MKITIHGAGREVGRSCIQVTSGNTNILFDAGLKLSEEGTEYPQAFDYSTIDGVLVSHAHLDHVGALPLFFSQGLKCPIYTTALTKGLSKILLKDSLKVELLNGEHPSYDYQDINLTLKNMQTVNYLKDYSLKNATFKYHDAGHIPGSACIELNIENKKIIYTGDIKKTPTLLQRGHNVQAQNVDVLIIESTYGDRDHPDRQSQEQDFLNTVEDLSHRGQVLIPAFALGRSQEVLMMLNTIKLENNIYLDGMGKKITNQFVKMPTNLADASKLKKALQNTIMVRSPRQRKVVMKENSIIVTTSGMLDGGPVIQYLTTLWNHTNTAILLTGYQAEGSNGRLLLDEGKLYLDGLKVRYKGTVKKYDFSAHSGQRQLLELVAQLKPKNVVLNHGDPQAIEQFRQKILAQNQNIKVFTPKNGEVINL
ncbi:MBL fold metallo-hydrolase [Candidatus Woesearchaeota archaeon]|nr:MBL fold metallo-hydrolase [Candidatus Woesearchaeota archaeon]